MKSKRPMTLKEFRRLEAYGKPPTISLELAQHYTERHQKKVGKDCLLYLDLANVDLPFSGIKTLDDTLTRTVKRLSKKACIWSREDLTTAIRNIVFTKEATPQEEASFRKGISKKISTMLADELIVLVRFD